MHLLPATVLLLGVLLTASCSAGVASAPTASPASAAFHGNEPPGELPSRPSFVLTDTDGERYDFAEQTGGRPTLLYFGYTNCPDGPTRTCTRRGRPRTPTTGRLDTVSGMPT